MSTDSKKLKIKQIHSKKMEINKKSKAKLGEVLS